MLFSQDQSMSDMVADKRLTQNPPKTRVNHFSSRTDLLKGKADAVAELQY